ncbi:MAG: proline iminopeptidase-family hydrolase [Acidimicrobiales bacterium]
MADLATYFDQTGRHDRISGGVRMVPIDTPSGPFKVWTKRVGNNPTCKLLLLHGGPGGTHEYFEVFDSYLPAAGVEYYYYDQLGSAYSDQPDDPSLWEIDRFVDEVEQVRHALDLGPDNFYLLGHSWGGILALEYALAHQSQLKGLIISNMMMSIPAYNGYAQEVLAPQLDPAALAEIRQLEADGKTEEPRYLELLAPYYLEHILRIPEAQRPEPFTRMFSHLNPVVYTLMNGPSELGAIGTLRDWDRVADLAKITVPTLSIGATHDTMDPEHMRMVAESVQRGSFLLCSDGSHCAMYDDPDPYFAGLITFLDP